MIPVILFIQSIVTSLKFFLKRLKVHEKKNQYRADPPLTANKIGATLKSCGSSCIPKNANNAKMTKIAPGLEIPMITAWKKSLREYDGVGSSFFIFRKFKITIKIVHYHFIIYIFLPFFSIKRIIYCIFN